MTISGISRAGYRFGLRIRNFIYLVLKHNIFFHSSAISYYTALAIAPFLLILLQVGSLMGHTLQTELIGQTYFILGPEVGRITEMIFSNVNDEMNLASISGIVGGAALLFTASMVFLQLRFSLDTIYGYHDPNLSRSFKDIVKERLFSMGVVVFVAILFFFSLFISNIVKYLVGPAYNDNLFGQILAHFISFTIYLMMFTVLYYFAPSRTPELRTAVKVALFTTVAFLFGKILIGLYFKNVAVSSVYGATGTLLVFLIWAYYSSFTLFLSLEGFLFIHRKEHRLPL